MWPLYLSSLLFGCSRSKSYAKGLRINFRIIYLWVLQRFQNEALCAKCLLECTTLSKCKNNLLSLALATKVFHISKELFLLFLFSQQRINLDLGIWTRPEVVGKTFWQISPHRNTHTHRSKSNKLPSSFMDLWNKSCTYYICLTY